MNYNDYELQDLTADQQLSMSAAFPVLMRKVYVWMTLALVITGFTSYGVATSPGILQAIYGNQILFWGLIIAEFALVIGVSAAINKLSLTTATLMFILYSVINGALLSYIFLLYTSSSIATVFFITAGTFATMALIGYTTKTIGVLIFVGLTAYDSQKIKQMLLQAPDAGEGAQKVALLGALTLYLDFINLFLYMLRIFGRRD